MNALAVAWSACRPSAGALVVACVLALVAGSALGRDEPPRASERPAADATAAERWWERMVAAEGRYRFDAAPDERSSLPGATPDETRFAWPVGVSPERVAAAFELEVVERTRVASRPVVVLRATPRHEGLIWTFWVDVETGARVAYQAALPSGRVVAEGRADGPPRDADGSAAPRRPREPSAEESARWRALFGGLSGFDAVEVARFALQPNVPALRVTLWDGLSGVVLLVFPARATLPERDLVETRAVGDLTLALVGPLEPGVASAYLDELAGRRWALAGWDALIAALARR